MYWGEEGQAPDPAHSGVVGSGFLVNTDGYYVTAAHVLQLYKPNSAQLTVIVKQRRFGGGSGFWFDVVERDEQHDLALCKLKGFVTRKPDKKNPKRTIFPISSLDVSSEILQQGQFIAIVGFPLGSWNSAVQFGTVAATETVNPNLPGVPAGRRELIQISASGNQGNSGGPVISLRTGKVIGVIDQAIPAPLWSNQPVPVMQNSGIMLAVPASWVSALLDRNHVKAEEHRPEENIGIGIDQ
jgi:S1-C subfamily serine protease